MTEIKSFRALLYNKEKSGDLSRVVCPPYDVISKEQQNNFYNLSPHNFIRIMLNKAKPSDNDRENVYTRSRDTFEKWIKEGVLVEDEAPCIYFYKQEYMVMGQKHSRLGFISLMKIQDEKDNKIFPHENTHSKAKEDRLKLWSTLGANLSPIFVCYSDKYKKVEKIFLREVITQGSVLNVIDEDGVKHTLWRLSKRESIEEIVGSLSSQQLFIADGHHRYEVAKHMRALGKERGVKTKVRGDYNWVMTYFTDLDSKDLQIFPMHRIVSNFPDGIEALDEFFRIDKIKSAEEMSILLAKAGRTEHAFGLYTRGGVRLLRLKNRLLINKYAKDGSSTYRNLDATILKYFIFDRLGIASEDIIYEKDINIAIGKVDNREADASFIMNPVKIKQLKDIALNGERMPPKTTYFYPKVLSGLTVYKIS